MGLSQQRMAEIVGVAGWRLAAWERDDGRPNAVHCDRIIGLIRDMPAELLRGLAERVATCTLPRALSSSPKLKLVAVSPPAVAKRPSIVQYIGRNLAPIAQSVLHDMINDRRLQRAIATQDVPAIVSTTRSVLDTPEAAQVGTYRTTINYFLHDGVLFSDAISVAAADDEPLGFTPITIEEIGSDLFGDRIPLERALSLTTGARAHRPDA